eukprot:1534161-Heterocapsa_arctica.AAC.1
MAMAMAMRMRRRRMTMTMRTTMMAMVIVVMITSSNTQHKLTMQRSGRSGIPCKGTRGHSPHDYAASCSYYY